MMKKRTLYIIIGVVSLLVLLLAVGARCTRVADVNDEAVGTDTTMVLIQKVRECARLYTAQVDVHKIVTHDDAKKLETTVFNTRYSVDLPLGQRKIAIPMDATVKAYVDFAGFSEENVRRQGKNIEIILPDPKVVLTQTKVRNEDIKKRVPLMRSDFTDAELTRYEAQGREDIIASIPKMNIQPMAEEGAAKVLVPLLEQLGYEDENITITFRKNFTLGELKRMIINE